MPGMTHAAGASAPKACWSGPELLQHPGLQAGNCAYVILERASHQLALHEAVMNEDLVASSTPVPGSVPSSPLADTHKGASRCACSTCKATEQLVHAH